MTEVLDLEGALAALARGAVVALPTDTVYGVAASLESPTGVAALFALKGRPGSVALPVLVDSAERIKELGAQWSTDAERLADRFWPGALTIIVRTPSDLARRVGSSTASVGFRIPDFEPLLEVLARSGPLCVSSANQHGDAPCHSVAEVLELFGLEGVLDGVLDGVLGGILDGGVRAGAVSTVVDISGSQWRIVREGAIPAQLIASILN
jgi:L-threonylcarbamoyladenylate synthase